MPFVLNAGPTQTSQSAPATTTMDVVLTGVSAGDLIVVGFYGFSFGANTLVSVSCSGESNLTLLTPRTRGSVKAQLAYLLSVSTGGTKTITATISSAAGFSRGLWAASYSGGAVFDAENGATAGSGTNATTAITTGGNNALLVGQVYSDSSTEPAAGSGFTLVSLTEQFVKAAGEYNLDAGTAGSKDINFTVASADWAVAAASFLVDPNTTKTPVTGSLLLGGLAPSVTVPIFITPSVGALSLGGLAPMVVSGLTVSPGALALTGIAGTATYSGKNAYPVVGSLTLDGLAPVPTVGFDRIPSTGSLVLTGHAGTATLAALGSGAFEALTGLGEGISPAFGDATFEELTATGEVDASHVADGEATFENLTALGYGPVEGAAVFERLTALGTGNSPGVGNGILEALRAENPSAYASFERLTAYGVANVTVGDTFSTKVLNTKTKALTEYTNHEFNSYAKIGDNYYGAGDEGIVKLDGDDDDGDDISWSFKTGQMDDKNEMLKRLPEIVFGLRSSGPVNVRVWKDDNTYEDNMLSAVSRTTIHQHRVKPGKGMRSRYYAIEVQGINNTKTEIDSVQLNFSKTSRRIG